MELLDILFYVILILIFYVLTVYGNTENLSPCTLKEWEEAMNMFSEDRGDRDDGIVYARNFKRLGISREYRIGSDIVRDADKLKDGSDNKLLESSRELTLEELGECDRYKPNYVQHSEEFSSGLDLDRGERLVRFSEPHPGGTEILGIENDEMSYVLVHYEKGVAVRFEEINREIIEDVGLSSILIRRLLFMQQVLIYDDNFRNYVKTFYPEYSVNSKLFLIYNDYLKYKNNNNNPL